MRLAAITETRMTTKQETASTSRENMTFHTYLMTICGVSVCFYSLAYYNKEMSVSRSCIKGEEDMRASDKT